MATTCGALDVYDNRNGSVTLSWPPFPGIIPDSYNIYVNGVLTLQGVQGGPTMDSGLITMDSPLQLGAALANAGQTQVTGLQNGASYSNSATPPAGDGSHRPESLPPVGQITDAQSYDIKVVAVIGGIEVAASLDRTITVGPTSVTLTTPMRRGRFAFPSTPGGY